MNSNNLEQELRQFTGTEVYTRWSALFRNFVLTDGALYLAEQAKCFWLMDAVASHLGSYRDEDFVVAKLFQFDEGWNLQLEDGNDNTLAEQYIEYSDFPLDEITLYVEFDGTNHVILLPSEH